MTTPQDALRHAMDAIGITDNETRAGIAAIAMGESGMLGHTETSYAHTSNDRIRTVFGSRVAEYTDAELNALKADDKLFFELVYGNGNSVGRGLGNVNPGDGYKYRGRGGLQITGRTNYTLLANDIKHPEIVANPDLVSTDQELGMMMSVAYIKRNYHGGGFDAMLHSVGNNTADIEATKRHYFAEFSRSGEFNVGATVTGGVAATPSPTVQLARKTAAEVFIKAVKDIQTSMKTAGVYAGNVDGDFGPASRTAFQSFANLTAFFFAALLWSMAALAAPAGTPIAATVDATTIVVAIVGGIFSTIMAVALAIINAKIKDKQAAEVISAAVKNSLGALQKAATSEIQTLQPHIPGVPPSLVPAVQYVLDQAPEAAARLGVDSTSIAQKVEAQIGLANIATNLAITANPATPEVVPPLAPTPAA